MTRMDIPMFFDEMYIYKRNCLYLTYLFLKIYPIADVLKWRYFYSSYNLFYSRCRRAKYFQGGFSCFLWTVQSSQFSLLGLLSTGLGLLVILAILLRVTKPNPKALIIIIIAKTGPVNGGTISTLVITAYHSKAAIGNYAQRILHVYKGLGFKYSRKRRTNQYTIQRVY